MSELPPELLAKVVVTGFGAAREPGLDPRPLLRERKMRKFMGAQDRLALAAASAALESAGLERDSELLGPRAGLFLCVGYLPFERDDIDVLCEGSCAPDGSFELEAFVSRGYEAVNPLLTFRCLSNMPAYHTSTNLGIQGPYATSYAGRGQLYACLEEALWALEEGTCERVLWGGVAYQQNFLVEHHLTRVERAGPERQVGDGAGVLVLEREDAAQARGGPIRARLGSVALSYDPRDPFEGPSEAPSEGFEGGDPVEDLGVASLPVWLVNGLAGGAGSLVHTALSDDGYRMRSVWEVAS